MAVLADRVCEVSATTGTGSFALGGAVNAAHRTFGAGFSTADTPFYTAVAVDGFGNPTGQWESGQCTAFSSAGTLPRTTILSNSNGDTNPVNFTPGTKQIFNAAPASFLASLAFSTALNASYLNTGTLSTARLSQTWLTSTSTGQTVAGGAYVTCTSLTSSTALTLDTGKCPLQYVTNNGAMSVAAPSNDGSMVLLLTNGATPGAVTFSGFAVGSNTGDSLTTSSGAKYMVFVVRINGSATYTIKSLQ
jgi:hypothetical protein